MHNFSGSLLPISHNHNELQEKICLDFLLRFLNKKSDFWQTVRRCRYGLHASCLPPPPTTDVIIFLQQQKSFKKKELHLTKFRFYHHHAVNKAQPTLPYHEFVIIIICTTYISIIIQSLVIIYRKIMDSID